MIPFNLGAIFYFRKAIDLFSPFPPSLSSSYNIFSYDKIENGWFSVTSSSLLKNLTTAFIFNTGNPSPEMISTAEMSTSSTEGAASFVKIFLLFATIQ